jgi:hypothetical protein
MLTGFRPRSHPVRVVCLSGARRRVIGSKPPGGDAHPATKSVRELSEENCHSPGWARISWAGHLGWSIRIP